MTLSNPFAPSFNHYDANRRIDVAGTRDSQEFSGETRFC